mmetsp:Transcript_18362/g.32326  ORF Transcript_18362/g.32326 Transcript_18362/m.32326 type:complete len:217 (+) Transcript_18362:1724-2374(+)
MASISVSIFSLSSIATSALLMHSSFSDSATSILNTGLSFASCIAAMASLLLSIPDMSSFTRSCTVSRSAHNSSIFDWSSSILDEEPEISSCIDDNSPFVDSTFFASSSRSDDSVETLLSSEVIVSSNAVATLSLCRMVASSFEISSLSSASALVVESVAACRERFATCSAMACSSVSFVMSERLDCKSWISVLDVLFSLVNMTTPSSTISNWRSNS